MTNDFLTDEQVEELHCALVGVEADTAPSEKRGSKRVPLAAAQIVAPTAAGQPLNPDALHRVRCHDISQGGISFCWPQKPGFREVFVALFPESRVVWVRSRVVRCMKSADGSYVVGCEFIERPKRTRTDTP